MSFSITQFENNATNQLAALDNNFTTFGALTPIPCIIAGTNVLTLTQSAAGLVPSPPIPGYSTDMLFTGVASGTNTQSVTAQVGSFPALLVYKDTLAGPVQLVGQEIVAGCAIALLYDAALSGGGGGFHLISSTAQTRAPVNVQNIGIGNNLSSTITNFLSGSASLTFTATPGWSSQDQTFTLSALAGVAGPNLPATGDFVMVNPPSLAATGVSYWAMVTGLGSLSSTSSVATVNVRLVNSASASLASNSGLYKWSAMRTVP
jgi:hypothetical protein